MGRAKKKEVHDAWEYYKSIQLTPEQKAEARAEAQKEIDRAARDGVYEEMSKLRGKIKWSLTLDELRKDDD